MADRLTETTYKDNSKNTNMPATAVNLTGASIANLTPEEIADRLVSKPAPSSAQVLNWKEIVFSQTDTFKGPYSEAEKKLKALDKLLDGYIYQYELKEKGKTAHCVSCYNTCMHYEYFVAEACLLALDYSRTPVGQNDSMGDSLPSGQVRKYARSGHQASKNKLRELFASDCVGKAIGRYKISEKIDDLNILGYGQSTTPADLSRDRDDTKQLFSAVKEPNEFLQAIQIELRKTYPTAERSFYLDDYTGKTLDEILQFLDNGVRSNIPVALYCKAALHLKLLHYKTQEYKGTDDKCATVADVPSFQQRFAHYMSDSQAVMLLFAAITAKDTTPEIIQAAVKCLKEHYVAHSDDVLARVVQQKLSELDQQKASNASEASRNTDMPAIAVNLTGASIANLTPEEIADRLVSKPAPRPEQVLDWKETVFSQTDRLKYPYSEAEKKLKALDKLLDGYIYQYELKEKGKTAHCVSCYNTCMTVYKHFQAEAWLLTLDYSKTPVGMNDSIPLPLRGVEKYAGRGHQASKNKLRELFASACAQNNMKRWIISEKLDHLQILGYGQSTTPADLSRDQDDTKQLFSAVKDPNEFLQEIQIQLGRTYPTTKDSIPSDDYTGQKLDVILQFLDNGVRLNNPVALYCKAALHLKLLHYKTQKYKGTDHKYATVADVPSFQVRFTHYMSDTEAVTLFFAAITAKDTTPEIIQAAKKRLEEHYVAHSNDALACLVSYKFFSLYCFGAPCVEKNELRAISYLYKEKDVKVGALQLLTADIIARITNLQLAMLEKQPIDTSEWQDTQELFYLTTRAPLNTLDDIITLVEQLMPAVAELKIYQQDASKISQGPRLLGRTMATEPQSQQFTLFDPYSGAQKFAIYDALAAEIKCIHDPAALSQFISKYQTQLCDICFQPAENNATKPFCSIGGTIYNLLETQQKLNLLYQVDEPLLEAVIFAIPTETGTVLPTATAGKLPSSSSYTS